MSRVFFPFLHPSHFSVGGGWGPGGKKGWREKVFCESVELLTNWIAIVIVLIAAEILVAAINIVVDLYAGVD